MPNQNDSHVRIQDLGIHGEGIGRTDSGVTVFVPGALPGETVSISDVEKSSKYWNASLDQILTPSEHRITPPCPVYASCGGCQLQHTTDASQLAWKESHVKTTLKKIGKLSVPVRPIRGSDSTLAYRNKAQFPVSLQNNTPQIGFYAPKSHTLVDIPECMVQHPRIQAVYSQIRSLLTTHPIPLYDEETHEGFLRHVLFRYSYFEDKVWVTFVATRESKTVLHEWVTLLSKRSDVGGLLLNVNSKQGNSILSPHSHLLWGAATYEERLGDLSLRFSAFSFSQINWPQTHHLYEMIYQAADLKGNEILWDLFCGVGSIGLFIAHQQVQRGRSLKSLLGVESLESAIQMAKTNAKLHPHLNAQFKVTNLEKGLHFSPQKPDCVIVDPPRKGLSKRLIDDLIEKKVPKIIYVSCNASTLARDVAQLTQKAYQAHWVQPVDMFPQTSHVECITLLTAR